MTYIGEGTTSAVFTPATGQGSLRVGPMTGAVVADTELTRGRYSLYRLDLAARAGGAAPHFHRTFAESFQVLSGAVELYDGSAWVAGGPGDHLFVPEGGIHGFRNVSDEPASMLMMSIPGARREAYFAELARVSASGHRLSPEEWTELFARHDQYMVAG
jgi:mannose-6-phosphate isomerase-like protein (cupin superfamily)